MQLISEEVSTSTTSVAVVNGEEGAPGPFVDLFEFGSDDIQNDADPIFIVVPHDALVGVR